MNPLILKLYKECDDELYFIRFLDYVISSRYPRVKFILNGVVAEPMISGAIRVNETRKEYYSIDEFYQSAGEKRDCIRGDRVLRELCVTDGATLWSVLEKVDEAELLNFVDQKYRAFLVYKDLESRIAPCSDDGYMPRRVLIKWESVRFYLTRSSIEDYTHTDIPIGPYEKFRFLSAYEEGECGENLWFYSGKEQKWVRLL
jgi:hypothetical protein